MEINQMEFMETARAYEQQLANDIAELKTQLAKKIDEHNRLKSFLGSKKEVRLKRGQGGKGRICANACIEIIIREGRRVPMNELFPELIANQIHIGGTDEKSVLAGYLSRDDRVDFVRGEGWGIVGKNSGEL